MVGAIGVQRLESNLGRILSWKFNDLNWRSNSNNSNIHDNNNTSNNKKQQQ